MVTPAIAYLRRSSAENVGGDSQHRQREAIRRFAKNGRELERDTGDDAAVVVERRADSLQRRWKSGHVHAAR